MIPVGQRGSGQPGGRERRESSSTDRGKGPGQDMAGLRVARSPPLKSWPASPFFEVPLSGSSMWQTSSGKGVAEIVIREDFPALSDDDLAYAKLVAASARYWLRGGLHCPPGYEPGQESYCQSNRTGITDIPRIRWTGFAFASEVLSRSVEIDWGHFGPFLPGPQSQALCLLPSGVPQPQTVCGVHS